MVEKEISERRYINTNARLDLSNTNSTLYRHEIVPLSFHNEKISNCTTFHVSSNEVMKPNK